MKTLLISIMFGMLLSGCANMVKTDSQDIVIETNSRLPHIITCNVINEEGSWEFEATHIGTIHRDGNTMEIKCTNGIEEGGGYVHPSFSGAYLTLDLLLDLCILSCWIDGLTNSWYEYPSTIFIKMDTIPYKGDILNYVNPLSIYEKRLFDDFNTRCQYSNYNCQIQIDITPHDRFNVKRIARHLSHEYGDMPNIISGSTDTVQYVYNIGNGNTVQLQTKYTGYRTYTFTISLLKQQ